jgi:glucose-1-phosphate thymidylyltransferase
LFPACHSPLVSSIVILTRGTAWLDTGTYDGLLETANFIETIQKRQGMYVSCVEEIAYNNKWISKNVLLKFAVGYKTEYGEYLRYIAGE